MAGASRNVRSNRQLRQTVFDGQLVTFYLTRGEPITGYIAGWDADSYFVLVPQHDAPFQRWIVTKALSPTHLIHEKSTFASDPQHKEMTEIIRPFKAVLYRERDAENEEREQRRTNGTPPTNSRRVLHS